MATMRAIQVSEQGKPPTFTGSAAKPSGPPADATFAQVRVIASGLHQLVRSQASGRHYSTASATFPYIPGADGVGYDTEGQLVYFNSINSGGGMAEFVNVPKTAVFPIPVSSSASDEEKRNLAIRVAVLFNPALSSWMALHTRTSGVPPNFTILINGVTSLSGQIAVKHARFLGANTIIGVARNAAAMTKLDLDIAITLEEDIPSTDFSSALKDHHVDIILDYLYGEPIVHLFNTLPSDPRTAHGHPIQYVQIGSLAGLEINLPSAILRSKNITIRGSGPGAWSVTRDTQAALPGCLERLCDNEAFASFGSVAVQRKLEEVDVAWADKARSVFVL